MPPPPATTFLDFNPQENNIIAIGVEDSSIQIYNVQFDEVLPLNIYLNLNFFIIFIHCALSSIFNGEKKLKGHQKKITRLEFSHYLNVLVSSGADSQVHGFFYCCIQSDFVILILKFAKIYQSRNVMFSQPNVFWQLCLQGIDGWDKRKSKYVKIQP